MPDHSLLAECKNGFIGNLFAQILEMWFDHRESFACCLLLDNERYAIIRSVQMDLLEQ